nr:uncharacterized protein LOC124499820 isoform X2 [Dermatophagoides farinae]
MVLTSHSSSSSSSIPRSKSSLDAQPKFYLIEIPRRVAFTDVECSQTMDNEEDNPFRPGSELSREADIIVNLIKEGKPITPTGDIISANNSNVAAVNDSQTPQKQQESLTKKQQFQTQTILVNKGDEKDGSNKTNNNKCSNSNNNGNIEPGQVEIQHGIIVANNDNMPTVEQINLKKKRKCCSLL